MLSWLRRRDPGLRVVRRAARVTVAACLGFYPARYLLNEPTVATYALFTAVALGALAQLPGSSRQRTQTLVAVLPVAGLLVTLGTLLAAWDLAAALGMFMLGFLVTYAGVGGPRLVSLAGGLQLLYILPCFPPYEPGTLGLRLAGVVLGLGLLVLTERTLWPDPGPRPYRLLLADAVDAIGECLTTAAGPPSRPGETPKADAALAAAGALRPSRLDPAQRPASASRTDRAFAQAGATARYLAGRMPTVAAIGATRAATDAYAELFRACAQSVASVGSWLRGPGPAPDPDPLEASIGAFRRTRERHDPRSLPPDVLRRGSVALAAADGVAVLITAVGVAAGRAPADRSGSFWYAGEPAWQLWWHRFRLHLTPRSVYFQGALRLALALAVARLVAGVLELQHGFWVLLAILTTMRASAAQTRALLRPALFGTTVGAVAAGIVLVGVGETTVYVVALPVLMLIGFAAAGILGLFWGQALFTVVIAFVFAQVGPRGWQLAEARVIDVLAGLSVGVLIGLLAWPRGGAGELRRAAGGLLTAASGVITETVAVLTTSSTLPDGQALPAARRQDELAEASYSLYQSEPRDPRSTGIDWQATLLAGRHALRGAEAQLRRRSPAPLDGAVRDPTAAVARAYDDAGHQVRDGESVPAAPPADHGWTLNSYHLADLWVWLEGLDDDLTRISAVSGRDRL